MPPAQDFVSDAHAHGKFIAHNEASAPLFEAPGIDDGDRTGYTELDGSGAGGDVVHPGMSQRPRMGPHGQAESVVV